MVDEGANLLYICGISTAWYCLSLTRVPAACDCHMRGVVRIEGWPDGDCVKDSSFRNIQGNHMKAGQCFCKEGWTGRRCDVCSDGWYGTGDECSPCGCSELGSVSGTCSQDLGRCECGVGYGGRKCDQCTDRTFSFPRCTESCSGNRAGVRCETCLEGFYLVSIIIQIEEICILIQISL